ncbi:MAG: hypothetical protein ACM31C_34760, partial [Acidobacteriota bacterium]
MASDPRAAQLLSLLPPARSAELVACGDLEALLAAQYRDACAAWPTFALPADRYVAAVAARVAARASEPAERVIRTLPAADVYLASACAAGDGDALAAFRDAMVPAMRQALGKLGMAPAQIDETIQQVNVMVFVG